MNGLYDYKRYAILYVDDEEKSLKYFTMAFEKLFRIFTATNAEDGFKILEQHQDDIGLLLTDQRMPGEKGVQLLEKARQLRPRVLRFLVTAYSDMDAAIQAVNSGAIYKYISKPWDIPELEQTLRRAMEFFLVQQERDGLLREKLTVLHNLVITDRVLSLGVLASGLSHHIRNSLVAVQTYLDLAPAMMQEEKLDMEALRNPNFWQDFQGQVQTQVDRITELLGELTSVSGQAPCRFDASVNLNEIIQESVAKVDSRLKAKNIAVVVQSPSELPPLNVDLGQFKRLFELLLADEAVSLRPNNRITIETQASPTGKQIEVKLSDDGPGLPENSLRSVFDPFFLRGGDPKEFGLNLMACYFIVYHHGGKIEVDSAPGQGTVFKLTLPVNPLEAPVPEVEKNYLSRVLMNESLWERLLTGV